MNQAEIDLWKLVMAGASVIVTIITVAITVLKERHASRERLRDEFRFSLEVEKARAEAGPLSRLSEQKAINAMLGRRDVPFAVGRYLMVEFPDADVAIRAYRAGRSRLLFDDSAQPRFCFKGINARRAYRRFGKIVGSVGYFVSCLFAGCPLIFAAAGMISESQAFQLLPMTLITGGAIAMPTLFWGAGFARAERLMKLQAEAVAAKDLAEAALSASQPAHHPVPVLP
ncbi:MULTISPECIES: hypothetical protein [Stenotrophomonas]|uniref:hypothetical protein n=1 Tax=Stenotrophomonas TaxID=40323 RepID=UPI0018D49814|nr:hypothetical protein [Stenotrophomonas sp.]MBH1508037.1 hypothetical protein [Stenotrophomonas maltophilia]